MKKKTALILVLLVFSLLLASCASGTKDAKKETAAEAETTAAEVATKEAAATATGEETEKEETAQEPEEQVVAEDTLVGYKDTIILGTASDQNFMDGHMNNTNDKVLRTVYSSLITLDKDNQPVGDLAEDWSVAEDGLTWTFTLKKGVKFHNGKELTSADVKASYDRLLDKENPVRYTETNSFIDQVNVIDDYTVEFVTLEPTPAFIANMYHRSNLILDADTIAEYGVDLGLTAESCNGTGPYKLVQWDQEEQMVFEAHEDYFQGAPPTKNFIITIITDVAARAIALETGEIDIADGLSTEDMARYRENPDGGIVVRAYDDTGLHGFQFNCAHEQLQDTRLRQAVSYAIDRETLVEALYEERGEYAATAPVSEFVWGYHDFGVVQQDQEKARALLAEAGYADGFEFSIMVYPGYNKGLESAEMMVSDLAEVGINATIEIVDGPTFKSYMADRTYPGENFPFGMFIMGYGPASCDADEGLRRIWTTSKDGDNNNNYGWYSNATVDELLASAQFEMDPDRRLEQYKEAQQILYIDDPASVFTNQRFLFYTMSDKVEDFHVDIRNAISYADLKCRE